MRYECDQCGACCRQLLVEAYELDAMRETKLLQADRHYASLPIIEAMEQLQDEYKCVLLAAGPNHPCMFLKENKCSIYPTRPNVCVGMQAGDEQCQMAREMEGLMRLKPVE